MALFGLRRRPRRDESERRRIADWAREAGGLTDDTTIKVSEIVCADPACPGMETVILLMPEGSPTRARKIAKPLADVTQEDVALVLSADR